LDSMNKAKLSDRIAWVMTLTVLTSILLFFFPFPTPFEKSYEGGVLIALASMGFGMTIMISEYEDRLSKGKTMMRLIDSNSEYDMDG